MKYKSDICSIEGCGLKRRTKGFCNLHYERMRKKGSPHWLPPTPIERFMSFIEVLDTGCWFWKGSKSNGVRSKGYGYFNDGIKNVIAHRWSYSFFKGPIPKGLTIHHRCYNPSCVNPEHLRAITQKENNYDSPRYLGNRTHCPMGHEYTPDNTIIHSQNGGRQCRICKNKRSKANRLDMKLNDPEKYSNWIKQCHKKK